MQVNTRDVCAQEWAKWAIKNLVTGHERAVRELKELRVQRVLPSAELQALGLEVTLDSAFNKLSIRKVGASAGMHMPARALDFTSTSSSSPSPP